ALTGTWEFSGKRGAMVLMHLPQLYQIPNNKLLNRVLDVKELRGKYIVSEVYTCPGPSLYLSGKSESFYSPLCPSVSMMPFAGDEQITGVKAGWPASNVTGMHQSACSVKSTGRYTPLFTLKRRKWYGQLHGRPIQPIREGDDRWEDKDLTWGPLDSDGE
ncbi:hypothetical protein FIBSPDRAFT_703082, partial [Athelia psychrophila]